MNIGFIGLGKMGRAIAGHLLDSGHRAAGKYEPAGFEATLGLKDIRLALEAADTHHVPMPFASVLRDSFLQLIAMGGGKQDWSALAQVAAQRAGLE